MNVLQHETKTASTKSSRVLRYLPGDTAASLAYFHAKLAYETDSSDVYNDLQEGITDFVVIDARSPESYGVERIPGAISVPHKQMNEQTTAFLPRHKVLVVYCDGIGCNASTKGAAKLTSLGFVAKELIGGLDWWKRDGYPVEGGQVNPNDTAPACGCE